MNARGFNKRIKIYQTRVVDDTYGGSTVTDNIITTTWAKLTTLEGTKISDLGLDYTKGSMLVTVRKRADFNYNSKTIYITYNDDKYTIASFPTDKDFVHGTITFIAVKEKPSTLPIYETL